MKDYSQPTTMKNPDYILIHVSTDGLPSKKQPDAIANDTVELGIEMWHFIIVSTKHYRKSIISSQSSTERFMQRKEVSLYKT